MARGYKASEAGTIFDDKVSQYKGPFENVFKYIRSSKRVFEIMQELVNQTDRHAHGKWADGWVSEKEGKEALHRLLLNKTEIARLVKALPPSVRKEIEAPKDLIKSLYRGVRDDKIEDVSSSELEKAHGLVNPPKVDKDWTNGNFVYGFTTNKSVAERFKKQGHEVHGAQIITADNIESFGGIIDLGKLGMLIDEYSKLVGYSNKTYPRFSGGTYTKGFSDYENEYLVYDLKFKKDGDRWYR